MKRKPYTIQDQDIRRMLGRDRPQERISRGHALAIALISIASAAILAAATWGQW